jgi:hypothetical protein
MDLCELAEMDVWEVYLMRWQMGCVRCGVFDIWDEICKVGWQMRW